MLRKRNQTTIKEISYAYLDEVTAKCPFVTEVNTLSNISFTVWSGQCHEK